MTSAPVPDSRSSVRRPAYPALREPANSPLELVLVDTATEPFARRFLGFPEVAAPDPPLELGHARLVGLRHGPGRDAWIVGRQSDRPARRQGLVDRIADGFESDMALSVSMSLMNSGINVWSAESVWSSVARRRQPMTLRSAWLMRGNSLPGRSGLSHRNTNVRVPRSQILQHGLRKVRLERATSPDGSAPARRAGQPGLLVGDDVKSIYGWRLADVNPVCSPCHARQGLPLEGCRTLVRCLASRSDGAAGSSGMARLDARRKMDCRRAAP